MSPVPKVTRMKIDQEHFIPVSKHKIRTRLAEAVASPADRARFEDFCKLIEAIYHFEYHDTQEELKRDFVPFHPVSGPDELEGFTDDEIDAAEDTFLKNFFLTMEQGNFKALPLKRSILGRK